MSGEDSMAIIRSVNFDISSGCNLRCRYCALDHDRKPGFMGLEMFERVLDEMADHSRFRVHRLQLHHGGDALLHPQFGELLTSLGSRKQAGSWNEVRLLTNAMLLKGEKCDSIFDSGGIDYIRFSVDGGTPESFERMRPPAKWDRVMGNIEEFLDENEARGRPLRTGMISMFDRPAEDLDPRFISLSKRVDYYMPRDPHHWDGSAELDLPPPDPVPDGLCRFVMVQVVVRFDGLVLPCCADLNGRGAIGDLNKSTLFDVVRGETRARMVTLMEADRRKEIAHCRTCPQGLKRKRWRKAT